MILHDFKCTECGQVDEHRVPSGTEEVECNHCMYPAIKIFLTLAKPHWAALAQGENASPEAINRFEKNHKQQKAKEDKTYAEHGDYGSAPGASGHSRHYNDQSL